ncbi:MAG: hypothetical protein WKG07_10510 [Hymenobacter sp.]
MLPWPPMPRAGRCCCAWTTGAGIFTCARCRWPSAITGCCGPAAPGFALAALSALPAGRPVWWDEYQKQGRTGEQSVLRVVLAHPALRTAYYLLLGAGLLFVLVQERGGGSASSRLSSRCRITARCCSRAPWRASTRQGRNHADCRRKENGALPGFSAHPLSGSLPPAWPTTPSAGAPMGQKAGVRQPRVDELVRLINFARHRAAVTDRELLILSRAIQDFKRETR